MREVFEGFGVDVEFDKAFGLYDVTGESENIVKVKKYLDENGFMNDGGAFEMFFGVENPDEAKINRIIVFIDGENKGYLPIAA